MSKKNNCSGVFFLFEKNILLLLGLELVSARVKLFSNFVLSAIGQWFSTGLEFLFRGEIKTSSKGILAFRNLQVQVTIAHSGFCNQE